MNQNEEREIWDIELADGDSEALDFESLERQLELDLQVQQLELESLKDDFQRIGTPESLGETVMNVVWEQFINQVGGIAGEDFIQENRGLTLDLRDSAHIQIAENFEKGKIATHNDKIDYQERYDSWQAKLQHDASGNVITHKTRTGRQEANLVAGARSIFDRGRPVGSSANGTDMDHTVSAGEIIRSSSANAHLSEQEQIAFANSEANLREMRASHNRSKKDTPMKEWLDTPNANGQKPKDIYADSMDPDYLSDELQQKYYQDDKDARAEYDRQIQEGERRSLKTGRQSQRQEAFRVGGKALRAVVMGLLASLIKDVIRKLIAWFRSGERKFSTFIESIKDALHSFFSDIKGHLQTAGDTGLTTILTAALGPIVGMLKKAWMLLKQGYRSVKQAIQFLKDPKNKSMPLSLKMMEVGKIVVVGLTAGGAILLSEVIEKALMQFPLFATPIPLLGSLGSILGMFLGGLVSGLIGALALNLIDRMIANKQKRINLNLQDAKRSEILATSDKLMVATYGSTQQKKSATAMALEQRHQEAGDSMLRVSLEVSERLKMVEETAEQNEKILQNVDDLLSQI
jgi:hypothetical protein